MKMTATLLATLFAASIGNAAVVVGPNQTQFTQLRIAKGEKCPPIRRLECSELGDPTEYKCTWQEQFKGKPWTSSTALVSRDAGKWIWLDGGPRCSPLPQS